MNASGIDTGQFAPLDDDARRERRAAITCAARILNEGGTPEQLLELLREIGLTHDPHALDRPEIGNPRTVRLRGPEC